MGKECPSRTGPALRALLAGSLRSRIWRSRLAMAVALVVMVVLLLPRGESVQEMTRLVWGGGIPVGAAGHPQSRYFGRAKTKFQVYLAATGANLALVLGKIGLSGSTGGGAAGHRVVRNDVLVVVANAAANFRAVRLGQLWSLILLTSTLPPKPLYPTRAFRPGC